MQINRYQMMRKIAKKEKIEKIKTIHPNYHLFPNLVDIIVLEIG